MDDTGNHVEGERVSVAADLIAQLAKKRGVTAAGSTLAMQVDDRWEVFVNGTADVVKHHACDVPRFHFFVEYNGWPAGLFSPFGGWFAAGDAANEDTFAEALRKEIAR